jgi:hypothetical protein
LSIVTLVPPRLKGKSLFQTTDALARFAPKIETQDPGSMVVLEL